MPALLHFYGGAVTYGAYWDMPVDELELLMQYRDEWIRRNG